MKIKSICSHSSKYQSFVKQNYKILSITLALILSVGLILGYIIGFQEGLWGGLGIASILLIIGCIKHHYSNNKLSSIQKKTPKLQKNISTKNPSALDVAPLDNPSTPAPIMSPSQTSGVSSSSSSLPDQPSDDPFAPTPNVNLPQTSYASSFPSSSNLPDQSSDNSSTSAPSAGPPQTSDVLSFLASSNPLNSDPSHSSASLPVMTSIASPSTSSVANAIPVKPASVPVGPKSSDNLSTPAPSVSPPQTSDVLSFPASSNLINSDPPHSSASSPVMPAIALPATSSVAKAIPVKPTSVPGGSKSNVIIFYQKEDKEVRYLNVSHAVEVTDLVMKHIHAHPRCPPEGDCEILVNNLSMTKMKIADLPENHLKEKEICLSFRSKIEPTLFIVNKSFYITSP